MTKLRAAAQELVGWYYNNADRTYHEAPALIARLSSALACYDEGDADRRVEESMTKLREAVEALLQELRADCWTNPEHSHPCDLPVCLAAEKVNAALASDDYGDIEAAAKEFVVQSENIDDDAPPTKADIMSAKAIIAAWRGKR